MVTMIGRGHVRRTVNPAAECDEGTHNTWGRHGRARSSRSSVMINTINDKARMLKNGEPDTLLPTSPTDKPQGLLQVPLMKLHKTISPLDAFRYAR